MERLLSLFATREGEWIAEREELVKSISDFASLSQLSSESNAFGFPSGLGQNVDPRPGRAEVAYANCISMRDRLLDEILESMLECVMTARELIKSNAHSATAYDRGKSGLCTSHVDAATAMALKCEAYQQDGMLLGTVVDKLEWQTTRESEGGGETGVSQSLQSALLLVTSVALPDVAVLEDVERCLEVGRRARDLEAS